MTSKILVKKVARFHLERHPRRFQGFKYLPKDIQDQYRSLLGKAESVLGSPAQYFAPMDLTGEEQQARGLINLFQSPDAYRSQIETFLSPYRDVITEDINKAFEAPQSALASRASEAGAFGSSRMRDAQADLEQARLGSIARALQGQYNVAQNQMQQSIGNLLNFGGLERGIDLEQRMALPRAIGLTSGVFSPLLSGSTSQTSNVGSFTTPDNEGYLSKAGKVGNLVGTVFSAFSDKRLKKNIKKVGRKNGLNIYEFEYLWSPDKYVGYIAQEVEKLFPKAVGEIKGFKYVNYGAING